MDVLWRQIGVADNVAGTQGHRVEEIRRGGLERVAVKELATTVRLKRDVAPIRPLACPPYWL